MRGIDQHGHVTAAPEPGEPTWVTWYRRGVYAVMWALLLALLGLGVAAVVSIIAFGRLV